MNRILPAVIAVGLLLPLATPLQAADPSPTPQAKIKSQSTEKKGRRMIEGHSAEFYAGGRLESQKPKGAGQVKARTNGEAKSSDKARAGGAATVSGMTMDGASAQKPNVSGGSALRTEGNAGATASPTPTPKPKRARNN